MDWRRGGIDYERILQEELVGMVPHHHHHNHHPRCGQASRRKHMGRLVRAATH